MTKRQAVRTARDRVRLVGLGHGAWTVHWLDVERNATWVSDIMDYEHACAYRRAALLEEALELLGVEDAGAVAFVLADKEGRWTDLLPDGGKAIARGSELPPR
jgi:hypothetical protein